MITCDRLRADAPGLAALQPGDPERVAAWSHASTCTGCARALREAERLQALASVGEGAPPPGALERASRGILAELRREARLRIVASIAAVCASMAAFVGFARGRSGFAQDWVWATILGALAIALAAAARRGALLALTTAVVAALSVAMALGHPGPAAAALGLHCLATELASAAMVVGATWLALHGGSTSPARSAVAAAAAAGALAGDAALQVTCGAEDTLPHLLAFHAGGVLLAAACASLLWGAVWGSRRLLRPA